MELLFSINFILALIIGIFIGGLSGYIGSIMVTQKMALMGGALGHLALPGIALALFYNFDVSIGALIFLIIGIIIIWGLQQITGLSIEAITAVVFPVTMSTSFLFLPQNKTATALIGDISSITFKSMIFISLVSISIFLIIKKIYKKLILITISKDIAIVNGINIKKYNFIFLACIAITVALGIRIVGGLMTAALIAIPASSSKNLSHTLNQYSFLSMFIGMISSFLGIILFKYTNISAGPMIIISSGIIFLISIFLKNKRQHNLI